MTNPFDLKELLSRASRGSVLISASLLSMFLVASLSAAAEDGSTTGATAAPARKPTPVVFLPNQGQTASAVRFMASAGNLDLYLTSDAVVFGYTDHDESEADISTPDRRRMPPVQQHAKDARGGITMKLAGGRLGGKVVGLDPQKGKSHFFLGNDPKKWRRNVPHYGRVLVKDVYPGVDLALHGETGRIEYDFVVAPGRDQQKVELEFAGMKSATVTPEGHLILKTGKGEIRHLMPRAYQESAGSRSPVSGRFAQRRGGRIGFTVGDYDRTRPLVIDPEVEYSRTFGGSQRDWANGVAGDSEGNAYITGGTKSPNFPVTGGAPDPNPPSNCAVHNCVKAFITKLDPSGQIVYSTYLGGTEWDEALDIAVADDGSAVVTGGTASLDFPVTGNAFQPTKKCSVVCESVFVTKIDPSGSQLLYSTYLGGSNWASNPPTDAVDDWGYAVALDLLGNIYITGLEHTGDFPSTPGSFRPTRPADDTSQAYVAKFNPSASSGSASLVYCTFLPASPIAGQEASQGFDIAVDWSGHAYALIWLNNPPDFPITTALDSDLDYSNGRAVAVKLNRSGSALAYATLFPQNWRWSGGGWGTQFVAVDAQGQLHVALNGPFDPAGLNGYVPHKIKVTKLNRRGAAIYSTFVQGPYANGPVTVHNSGAGVAVDAFGGVFAAGCTLVPNTNPVEFLGCWVERLNLQGQLVATATVPESGAMFGLGLDGNLYFTGSTAGDASSNVWVEALPGSTLPDPDASSRDGCCVGEPVNVATGNVFLDQTDIAIPGLGPALAFTRSYNSTNASTDGALGPGWNHPYEKRLILRPGKELMFHGSDGVVNYFVDSGSGRYDPSVPLSKESWFVFDDPTGTYTHNFRDGSRESYDEDGRLTSLADPLGNTTTLEPDANGNLWHIKNDQNGRTLTLTYVNGLVNELDGADGWIARYAYTGGKLASVDYRDSSGYAFGYDSGDRLATVSDREGRTVESHSYHPDGRAATSDVAGQEGYMLSYAPNVTTVTDGSGAKTTYEWAEFGGMKRVTKLTRPCSCDGGGASEGGSDVETELWTYYNDGRVETHTDAAGLVTRYTYNANGDLASQTDAFSTAQARTTTYTYLYDGTTGRITQRTRSAPGEGTTTEDYATPAGLSKVTRDVQAGEQRITQFTYRTTAPLGLLDTITDPRGKITKYTYFPNGDLQYVDDPRLHRTTFGYNTMGWRNSVTDPEGNATTTDYDPLGRVKTIHHPPNPNPAQTDFTYDKGGLKTSVKDPLGKVTQYRYDSASRLEYVIDAAGGTTRYGYEAMSRLRFVTDAQKNTTSFDYYLGGRLKTTTSPDAKVELLTYDGGGRLKTKTDRNGVTTTFVYDVAGRLGSKTYSNSEPTVQLGYDTAWRVNSVANGTDTVTRTYDLAGQLRTETSSKNATTLTYGYDAAGNRSDLKLNGSTFTTYTYDDDSLLDFITRGTSIFDPGYDKDHRRTSLSYPNGIAATYGYDQRSQLKTLDVKLGSTIVTQFGYAYDAAGNRILKTTPELSETYGYDTLYRLKSVNRTGISGVWVYGYDKVGNRTSEQSNTRVVQGSHNVRNQLYQTVAGGPLRWRGTLSEAGKVTFTSATVNGLPAKMLDATTFEATILATPGTNNVTVAATDNSNNVRTSNYRVDVTGTSDVLTYDSNGNLLTRTDGPDTWTYGWNAENQLLRACKNASPCTDANATARFKYDSLGRRVEKVAGGVTTAMVYDGADILQQTTGVVVTRYVHGPGVDEPLAQTDGSNNITGYFHADGLGSVVKMTDTAGNVTATRRYDAYGTLDVGSTTSGYAFTGREWDSETGLYYYRARYYDPRLGRFLSEDPIGFTGGVNFYSYVSNSPINLVDPLGTFPTLSEIWDAFKHLDHWDLSTPEGVKAATEEVTEQMGNAIPVAGSLKLVEESAVGARMVGHHVFPRAFRAFFEAAGIDIDRFLVKIPQEWHQKWVHAAGARGGRWNAAWAKFIAEHPGASAEEIWAYLRKLLDEVGLCGK